MAANQEQNSTRENLLAAGIRLFGKYGFEATTTRMIAEEAGANIAGIAFHFQNKANFYKKVLEHAAEDMAQIYEPFYTLLQTTLEKGVPDAQTAWRLMEQLVALQLHFAVDQPRPYYLSLLYWEQLYHEEGFMPLTELVQSRCEEALAYLLQCYAPHLEAGQSALISRLINGGLISFGEHPAFLEMLRKKAPNQPLADYIKRMAQPFVMESIRHNCGMFVPNRQE